MTGKQASTAAPRAGTQIAAQAAKGASVKPKTGRSSAAAKKRPASCMAHTAENPPSCPSAEEKTPIEYEGGKIYNCAKNFRVLRDKADMYSEKSFAHAKWTRDVGFQKGLAAIDEYWKEHEEMVVKLRAQEPCDGEDVE